MQPRRSSGVRRLGAANGAPRPATPTCTNQLQRSSLQSARKLWLSCTGLTLRAGPTTIRNQRLRRALLPTAPPATVSPPAVLLQTTAEDIAVLDARFPWLRGAE